MRKITLDGAEYTVKIIPPYLLPFLNLYSELATKPASTIDEAEKISNDMRMASQKILSVCVTPEPKPEHETELFRYLSNLTGQAVQEIDSFFQRGKNGANNKVYGRIKLLDKDKTINTTRP
ncbi:MAG: hypothetical protein ACUVTM_06340 [Candidatus Bathyarchaeia archaeon]